MNRMSRFPSLPHLEHRSRLIRTIPFLVLSLSLSITLFGWHTVSTATRLKAHQIYTGNTEDVVDHLVRQLHVHQLLLRGGGGLFDVKSEVTRGDWRDYVAALQLDQYHPGIQGVGYAVWLTPEGREAHLRTTRSEGFPNYTIHPGGERSVYTSVVYLEPFTWRNQRAFGYDMYTEPLRHAAMELARDTGGTTIAAPITLVQETAVGQQSGMLMYLPVYRQGMSTDSVADRRAALRGFVYSPIRMNDFVYGTLGKLPDDIAFEIYAGAAPAPATVVFSSLQSERMTLPPGYRSLFTSSRTIDLFGSSWHITFRSLPPFDAALAQGRSPLALVGGGFFVSLLLSVVTYMLLFTRDKALSLAREMTDELRKNELLLAGANEELESLVGERTAALSSTNAQLLREIDERKKIEQEMLDHQRLLQAMSLELAMAEERERDRIAGELHDQVGQRLILTKMKLDALTSRLEAHPLEQSAAEVVSLVEQTIQDTRSLTFQIRPPLLASAGLEATVQWLGEELKANYGLRMLFTADTTPKPLPYEICSTLFHAVRELLLNVARHAGTNEVRVRVMRDITTLVITIHDDGVGFDTLEARTRKTRSGGFGLFNIQQRIEYLGGSVVIDSGPGAGTRATITVPTDEEDQERRVG